MHAWRDLRRPWPLHDAKRNSAPRVSLRIVAVVCHLLLAAALATSIVLAGISWLRIAAVVAVTLPLLLTLRGLIASVRTIEQRLCVLLVLYVGGAAVEVVAQSGTAPLANAALVTAALELALVLVLIRRQPRRAPAARE